MPVLSCKDHHMMMKRGTGLGGVISTISVETLLDADEGFLHDGTLTVGVHISVNAQVLLSSAFAQLCYLSSAHVCMVGITWQQFALKLSV